jgi:hypothetical protein
LLELYKVTGRTKEARGEEAYVNGMDEDIKPFK